MSAESGALLAYSTYTGSHELHGARGQKFY